MHILPEMLGMIVRVFGSKEQVIKIQVYKIAGSLRFVEPGTTITNLSNIQYLYIPQKKIKEKNKGSAESFRLKKITAMHNSLVNRIEYKLFDKIFDEDLGIKFLDGTPFENYDNKGLVNLGNRDILMKIAGMSNLAILDQHRTLRIETFETHMLSFADNEMIILQFNIEKLIDKMHMQKITHIILSDVTKKGTALIAVKVFYDTKHTVNIA